MKSITITPLQPPFTVSYATIAFHGEDKILAISKADHNRLCELFGAVDLGGFNVTLAPVDDGRICITLEDKE